MRLVPRSKVVGIIRVQTRQQTKVNYPTNLSVKITPKALWALLVSWSWWKRSVVEELASNQTLRSTITTKITRRTSQQGSIVLMRLRRRIIIRIRPSSKNSNKWSANSKRIPRTGQLLRGRGWEVRWCVSSITRNWIIFSWVMTTEQISTAVKSTTSSSKSRVSKNGDFIKMRCQTVNLINENKKERYIYQFIFIPKSSYSAS